MGKISTKPNKTAYQLEREKLHLTRAEAADKMSDYGMTEHRLVRIEDGTSNVEPEDVYAMSKAYNAPQLCNHYCSNDCRIGREYVPEIKVKELSGIVLEMLASLNSMKNRQEKLIEITADGVIDDVELEDFVNIQKELERISVTVETLQLWVEKMIADGKINMDKYKEIKSK